MKPCEIVVHLIQRQRPQANRAARPQADACGAVFLQPATYNDSLCAVFVQEGVDRVDTGRLPARLHLVKTIEKRQQPVVIKPVAAVALRDEVFGLQLVRQPIGKRPEVLVP